MPTLTIKKNGTTAGAVLSAASSVVKISGDRKGGALRILASDTNSDFQPVTLTVPVSALGPGVYPLVLPSGWYVALRLEGAEEVGIPGVTAVIA